jgi:hypothetical protein
MKKFLLIASMIICSLSISADNSNFPAHEEIDHSVESISLEKVQELKSNKRNNCYAYTRCWGGRVIQCQTYGPGCTFFVQPGQYVECNGYNMFGQWVNTYAYCR